MIVYGIIQQTEDDISCYAVFNSKSKRDHTMKYLEKHEQSDTNLFYSFDSEVVTASIGIIKEAIERKTTALK